MSFKEEAYEKIVSFLGMVFDVEPEDLSPETDIFTDLGAKSVNISQMSNFIQDEYEVSVNFVELRKQETIAKIVDFIVELCDY